jgi:hypothetical protein
MAAICRRNRLLALDTDRCGEEGIMNIKSVFRLSLILALVAVPLTGFAQEGDQGTAASLGQPGPWIFTFFGTEYTISSAVAAQGNVESSVEVGIYDASTDDSPDMAAEYLRHRVRCHRRWSRYCVRTP